MKCSFPQCPFQPGPYVFAMRQLVPCRYGVQQAEKQTNKELIQLVHKIFNVNLNMSLNDHHQMLKYQSINLSTLKYLINDHNKKYLLKEHCGIFKKKNKRPCWSALNKRTCWHPILKK